MTNGTNTDEIENSVVRYYLDSRDYNGISLSKLAGDLEIELDGLLVAVRALVYSDRIAIASPRQGNPHIFMFCVSIEEQLDGLEERDPGQTCLYPTPGSVQAHTDVSEFDDRPFTRMLVLGAPQLNYLGLRMDVLDSFESDPRYEFVFQDSGGRIHTREEHNESMDEDDRVRFRFGIGYKGNGERVVAANLHNLGNLSGRQQRIFNEFLEEEPFTVNEEHFRMNILAEMPKTLSVYQAIIFEQVEINKLFSLLGRTGLFRETYEENKRPRGFSVFFKPTRREYDEFIQMLDKMLSDNIDTEAFGDDVDRQRIVRTKSGEIERQQKASITLLNDWLVAKYPGSQDEIDYIIEALREVRRLRMKPAHIIRNDEYDIAYYELQEKMVGKIHDALSRLRRLLSTDEASSEYELPHWEGFLVKNY